MATRESEAFAVVAGQESAAFRPCALRRYLIGGKRAMSSARAALNANVGPVASTLDTLALRLRFASLRRRWPRSGDRQPPGENRNEGSLRVRSRLQGLWNALYTPNAKVSWCRLYPRGNSLGAGFCHSLGLLGFPLVLAGVLAAIYGIGALSKKPSG